MNRDARSRKLVEAALSNLAEYYEILGDGTLVAEIESAFIAPNTGNDQSDYESVKASIEDFLIRQSA